MQPLGLLKFCEAIGEIDRGKIPDCGSALDWLAGQLHIHTGADVAIWLAELVGGELPDDLDSPARIAMSPGKPAFGSVPLCQLTFLGESAAVGNAAAFTEAVHDGPKTSPDFTLADGERALVFRVRLDFALCWVRVSGPASLLADRAPWREMLPPALHGFLRGVNHDQRLRFRQR